MLRWATADCTGDTVQGYRVGWVNANSKAIQAIGTHVITHNDRVSGSKEAADMLAMLYLQWTMLVTISGEGVY